MNSSQNFKGVASFSSGFQHRLRFFYIISLRLVLFLFSCAQQAFSPFPCPTTPTMICFGICPFSFLALDTQVSFLIEKPCPSVLGIFFLIVSLMTLPFYQLYCLLYKSYYLDVEILRMILSYFSLHSLFLTSYKVSLYSKPSLNSFIFATILLISRVPYYSLNTPFFFSLYFY